jgi:diadenosine tetraphosphatase ApaH/serine/threonine PP2A family protein phosphatase
LARSRQKQTARPPGGRLEVDRQGILEILCLGDIVGYGPDPIACTDLVRARCQVVICGNHDEALVKGPWGFNQLARRALEWTQKELRPRFYRPGSRARWEFLANLPLRHEWKGYYLVHGSPRDPTSEYVMPHHVSWPQPGMFEAIFEAFSTVCFVGHTHIPGVFSEEKDMTLPENREPAWALGAHPCVRFTPQSEIRDSFRFEGVKLLVNVGSVGQPRDRNWRACYLTVDEGEFRYHRVEYPVEVTQRKIRDQPDLDDRLGERLGTGE